MSSHVRFEIEKRLKEKIMLMNTQRKYANYVSDKNKLNKIEGDVIDLITGNTPTMLDILDKNKYQDTNYLKEQSKLDNNLSRITKDKDIQKLIYDKIIAKFDNDRIMEINKYFNGIVNEAKKKLTTSNISIDDFIDFMTIELEKLKNPNNDILNTLKESLKKNNNNLLMDTPIINDNNKQGYIPSTPTTPIKNIDYENINNTVTTSSKTNPPILQDSPNVTDITIETFNNDKQSLINKLKKTNAYKKSSITSLEKKKNKTTEEQNKYDELTQLQKQLSEVTTLINNSKSYKDLENIYKNNPDLKLNEIVKINTTGSGLKKYINPKRIYKKILLFGSGYNTSKNLIQINKFYIDMDCLDKNIIKLKYVKNRNIVPTCPITYNISNDVKTIIYDIVKNEKFNNELYNKLNQTNKEIIINFCDSCHIDCNISNDNKNELENQINILYGEYKAGNKNSKTQLMNLLKKAMYQNKLSQKTAMALLDKLF